MPLWGRGCPLLALAAFAFLSLEGDGLVRSRLALLSPLFCEWAWWCLKVKVKLLNRVRLFVTPWTVTHQAPPFMGFSRQEYWSGLPFG